MVDVARRGDHDVGWAVPAPVKVGDLGRVERVDGFWLAEHLSTERVSVEESFVQHDVHDVVGGVEGSHELFVDDLTLGVNINLAKGRTAHDVEEQLGRHLASRGRNSSVEGGVLSGSEGVHVAPYPIDHLGDLARRTILGALEQQVFQKVRGTRERGGLITRTNRNPGTDRRTARPGHRLSEDSKTIRECCFF